MPVVLHFCSALILVIILIILYTLDLGVLRWIMVLKYAELRTSSAPQDSSPIISFEQTQMNWVFIRVILRLTSSNVEHSFTVRHSSSSFVCFRLMMVRSVLSMLTLRFYWGRILDNSSSKTPVNCLEELTRSVSSA